MTRRYDDLDDPEDDTATVAARQADARKIARHERPTQPATAREWIARIRDQLHSTEPEEPTP